MSDAKVTFGTLVKLKRKNLGLTQSQLAEKINYSIETIRAVENRNYSPSTEMREAIMKVLQIEYGDYSIEVIQPVKTSHKINREYATKVLDKVREYKYPIARILLPLIIIIGLYFQILSYTGEVWLHPHPDGEYVIFKGEDGRKIENGGEVKVGEMTTVSFMVKNVDDHTIIIPVMLIGARGPGATHADDQGWDAPEVGFHYQFYVFLNPGNVAVYEDQRQFLLEGDYFIEPVYADIRWWHGIQPFTRIYFTVVNE